MKPVEKVEFRWIWQTTRTAGAKLFFASVTDCVLCEVAPEAEVTTDGLKVATETMFSVRNEQKSKKILRSNHNFHWWCI